MIHTKWRMEDVLVVLPGITGSVLEKADGTPVWAPAPRLLLQCLRTLGASLLSLRIDHQDPDYDDGVRATGLVPYSLVPGLAAFDGYSGLRRHLFSHFDLTAGDARGGGPPANYFEFPYDWRRDNRHSAARLRQLVDRELPRWREHTRNPDARVVLLAHSMGGLVARWYVEALEGFLSTRALITFGTPHRGSVHAIESLVHGYRKLGVTLHGLSDALRTLPSVYQLLPRYPCVLDTDSRWKRVYETADDIPHLDRARAADAAGFYRQIDAHAEQNRRRDDYRLRLLPIFGWGQSTLQSVAVLPGTRRVLAGEQLPPDVDTRFANGDGTVPRVSAIPLELDDEATRWWPVNQKHATLQNHPELLGNLAQALAGLRARRRAVRGPARGDDDAPAERGVGLHVDDLYVAGEPAALRVTTGPGVDPRGVVARIQPVGGDTVREVPLVHDGYAWVGEAVGLEPDAYRVAVHLVDGDRAPAPPVCALFAVE